MVEGAKTEYREQRPFKCGFLKLKTCYEEIVHNDFDLTKKEDVQKLNDMGFELVVRERPR